MPETKGKEKEKWSTGCTEIGSLILSSIREKTLLKWAAVKNGLLLEPFSPAPTFLTSIFKKENKNDQNHS
jgi:hypothetical protein